MDGPVDQSAKFLKSMYLQHHFKIIQLPSTNPVTVSSSCTKIKTFDRLRRDEM